MIHVVDKDVTMTGSNVDLMAEVTMVLAGLYESLIRECGELAAAFLLAQMVTVATEEGTKKNFEEFTIIDVPEK
ncbi:MAG: hypothetical protein PUF69_04275 [Eubacteriales bacterium]|nr:hypothetical protein [Eubacteriales bacterium]